MRVDDDDEFKVYTEEAGRERQVCQSLGLHMTKISPDLYSTMPVSRQYWLENACQPSPGWLVHCADLDNLIRSHTALTIWFCVYPIHILG